MNTEKMDFLPKLSNYITKAEADLLNPLVLALLGDSVQTLFERTRAALTLDTLAGKLHSAVAKKINAKNQAQMAHTLIGSLNEDELAIYKRARNHDSHKAPKNTNVGDYHASTGLEAVFGYLYVIGDYDRLYVLLTQE